MRPRLQASRRIGPKAGVGRELPFTARVTLVSYFPVFVTPKTHTLFTNSVAVGAHDAYEEALRLDASNAQAKAGLDSVKRAIDAEAKADGAGEDASGGLGNMFNDPQLIQKLASNPKTSSLIADPEFMAKIQRLKQNPNSIGEEMRDPRFLQVMSVLLGVDMSFGAPPEAGGPSDSGVKDTEEDVSMPDARPPKYTEKAPEPEPEPEDEESIAKRKAKEAGDAEKKLGTEKYKKREFDAAIAHYSKAWELNKDITYLTNLSAAKFEKGDYQGAIETCEEAIAEGRQVLADFKIISKSVFFNYAPYFHVYLAKFLQGLWENRYILRETG